MYNVPLFMVMFFVPYTRGALVPVTTVDDSSLLALQQGIDRICNASILSDLFLISNEDPSRGSVFISRFNFERPVTLRGVRFKGRIKIESCFVAFIASSDLSQVVQDHLESFGIFIAVLPKDAMETVRSMASMMDKCVMYYFFYDPVTLTGTWVMERNGQKIYGVNEAGSGLDMRGQRIIFLNLDIHRESTYDIAMGQTIAMRHNGSFMLAKSLLQCHDYMYSAMYATVLGSFVTLPEVFQLCFVVPKSPLKTIFSILSDPFDVYCWGVFIFTICMLSVLLWVFGESYRRYNVGLIFLELVMHALNGPSHRFHGRFEVRIIGLFMLMNIVLLSCYQSLIISLMSSDRYEPELETIEQINDTCQFQRDVHMESLGYRFKNTFYTFEMYGTFEQIWANKICHMVMCSDINTGHTLIATQNTINDENGYSLSEYFRYSKARIRSAAVMYLIMPYSPMRTLIERYAAAYNEGHLHHFPLLKERKSIFVKQNTHATIVVVSMQVKDLLIVWFIFVIGCVASFLVFLIELSLTCIPEFCEIARLKVCKTNARIKRSSMKKIHLVQR